MMSDKSSAVKTGLLVASYLGAAVAANLAVAAYGPAALLVSAVLLIPFDLCARDVLHERWEGRGPLFRNMAVLIAGGSLLTCLVSPGSQRVAVASMLAFAAASAADALGYTAARSRGRLFRMNFSNLCGAAADSLIFPLAAFGATTAALTVTQAAAKLAGGLFWSWLFVGLLRRRGRRQNEV